MTSGTLVLVKGNDHHMLPCDHEEANIGYAVQNGYTVCLIHTVDTDLIVILIGKFYHLLSDADIWVAFDTGKNFNINSACAVLDEQRFITLLVFHSYVVLF